MNVQTFAAMHESSHQFSVQFADDDASARNVPPDMTLHESPIEDGALLGELRTVDPIVSLQGSWSISLRPVITSPNGDQPMVETLEGLVAYVRQILAVLYGGATRDDDSAEASEPWTPYDPDMARLPTDQ